MLPIALLVPEYLHSLPAPQCTPDTPTPPDGPKSLMALDTPYTPRSP